MRRLPTIAMLLVATVGLLPFTVGCNGFSSTLNFANLMSCSTTPQIANSDLIWQQVTVTPPGNEPRPGDIVSLQFTFTNDAGAAGGPGSDIKLPSNLRVFFSFDMQIGPEDYIVAEYIVNGAQSNLPRIMIEEFILPRPTAPPPAPNQDNYFPVVIPDPNGAGGDPHIPGQPGYIGPISITYNVICVLDSSNCIIERRPGGGTQEPMTREDQRGPAPAAYDPNTIAINNQFAIANGITLFNPNLPNLSIEFREHQPDSLPMLGGFILSDWRILNSGIGPVDGNFQVQVFLSENERLDSWDVNITQGGNFTVNGPIFSGGEQLVRITLVLPYTATRRNTYAGFTSALSRGPPPVNQGRDPPPANPPTWDFTVYLPIPATNLAPAHLVAFVDSGRVIREAAENDNVSTVNGNLTVREDPPGGGEFDLEALEVTAGMNAGFLELDLRYVNDNLTAVLCSIAIYFSQDELPSSADFFGERFYFQLLPTDAAGAMLRITFAPSTRPSPGDWYVVIVIDDILVIDERNDNNNFAISLGTVRLP